MKQPECVKVRKVGNAVVVTLTERAREVFDVELGDTLEISAFKGRVTYRLISKSKKEKSNARKQ